MHCTHVFLNGLVHPVKALCTYCLCTTVHVQVYLQMYVYVYQCFNAIPFPALGL